MKQNASRLLGLYYLHASQKATDIEDQERLKNLSPEAVGMIDQGAEELEPVVKNALTKGQQLNTGIA
jgi:hypothetical protein